MEVQATIEADVDNHSKTGNESDRPNEKIFQLENHSDNEKENNEKDLKNDKKFVLNEKLIKENLSKSPRSKIFENEQNLNEKVNIESKLNNNINTNEVNTQLNNNQPPPVANEKLVNKDLEEKQKTVKFSSRVEAVTHAELKTHATIDANVVNNHVIDEKMIDVNIIRITNEVFPNIEHPDLLKSPSLKDNDKIRTVGGRVIPKLNPTLAIGLLIVNIFFPGLGTMIVGCVSSQKDVCGGWFCIGFLQMIFALCIFGWVWAIISACAIVSVANDPDYSDDVIVVVKQSN